MVSILESTRGTDHTVYVHLCLINPYRQTDGKVIH